jgi:demethylmenaquinone methyltransferase / 2-methoxy-6-polyprenyl-1,4-benzoquinol methylase
MPNKFHVPGEQRAARVEDLFEAIAPRYDLINDLQSFGLHRLWKRKLIRLARVRPGDRTLDLCCGTGDVTVALARMGARAAGLDFSAPMLGEAVKRLARRRSLKMNGTDSTVLYVRGDSLRIPFEDQCFDAVTMSYGLRNLASVEGGLAEMLRVARPSARLLVLDFGKPRNALLRSLYFSYLRFAVPWFGRLFCGDADAYGYIRESLEHYPAQEGVARRMRDSGFANVRVFNLLGGIMGINYGEKPPG